MKLARMLRPTRLALLLAWVALAFSPSSLAQTPAEKAQAQVLFDEGRTLMKEGNVEEACGKFADSQALDPQLGTQLNLAVCYEKLGKTASAWALFVELQSKASQAGRHKRAEFAKQHAEALAPKLSKLRVEVSEPVDGLAITRGEETIAETAWGISVPIDPGEHTIEAKAPGKKDWSTQISVGAEADEVTVEVPPLEDAPAEAEPVTPKPKPDAPEDDGTVQLALGWTALAAGGVAAGVGVLLRVMALDKDDEAAQYCLPEDPDRCTIEGAELRDDAQALELGSVIAWVGGGALVVTGIVLLLTAPSDDEAGDEESPVAWRATIGPDGGAMQVRLRW